MTTGVFLYTKKDLAAYPTIQSLLQYHVTDLSSKRARFKLLEPQTQTEHDGKRLTTVVYDGEKPPKKYIYRFTAIEFLANPEIVVVVLQVAIPSDWAKAKPILQEITKSARIRSDISPKSQTHYTLQRHV